jgi:hypothetical protein
MNEPLIRATMEYIEKRSDEWNQDKFEDSDFDCNTQRCFFGWAVMIAHPEIASIYQIPRVNSHGTFVVGMELLGLSEQQAEEIVFSPEGMSLQEFKGLVQKVTGIDLT